MYMYLHSSRHLLHLCRPFGFCYDVLTPRTVEKYFMPIIDLVPQFLDKLTDEELKKGSKTEVKNDALSSVVKALKYLASRVPNQEEKIKSLEMFRLKMILRFVSSCVNTASDVHVPVHSTY